MEEHTKATSGSDPTKWAILVGVDYYSRTNPKTNLKGCANDAVLVYHFLHDVMKVPTANIFLHLERNPASPASIDSPDPTNLRATKDSILKSIQTVTKRAKKGHLVHVHFSGHGGRRKNPNPSSAPSEYLYFADAALKDVDFGELLDNMARKGEVTVLVTLDCCFSGGATRDHQPEADQASIRCKPESDDEDDRFVARNGEDDDSDRHVTLQKGVLYRDRHYTVMTACQPHEKCREFQLGNRRQGVFTWSLISQLRNVYGTEYTPHISTYEMLQGVLEATIHRHCDKNFKERQHPTLFGPRSRVLFKAMTLDDSRGFAFVTSVAENTITLNRGRVSGTERGDKYRLSPLAVAPNLVKDVMDEQAIVVEVTAAVQEYDCTAKLSVEWVRHNKPLDLQTVVEIGWLARLIERKSAVQALITHDEHISSVAAFKRIRQTWSQFCDPTVPIDLVFPDTVSDPIQPRFKIRVEQRGKSSDVEILNSRGEPFPLLGKIPAVFPDLPRRLMGLLRHLQSYLLVSELRSSFMSGRDTNMFSLELSKPDYTIRADEETLDDSKQRMYLENKARRTLYVTVMNLTPTYGVMRLFPSATGEGASGGKPVDDGAWMKRTGILIEICVPVAFEDRYRKDPAFEMKDIIKVFVTTKPTDLRHYELDELDDQDYTKTVFLEGLEEDSRTAKRVVEEDGLEDEWWIEEFEIVTKGLKAGNS